MNHTSLEKTRQRYLLAIRSAGYVSDKIRPHQLYTLDQSDQEVHVFCLIFDLIGLLVYIRDYIVQLGSSWVAACTPQVTIRFHSNVWVEIHNSTTKTG